MLDSFTTMTGMTFRQVLQKMGEILPPEAYKEVKGQGVELTDINPAYLTPVAIECFGLPGVGWWVDYRSEDTEISSGMVKYIKEGHEKERMVHVASIKRAELRFRYYDAAGNLNTSEPVVSNGASENSTLAYSMRGALTNAIGAAFAKLLWQLLVYQGKLTHKNAATMYSRATGQKKPNKLATPDEIEALAPEKPKAASVTQPDKVAAALAPVEAAADPQPDEDVPDMFDRTKETNNGAMTMEKALAQVVPDNYGLFLVGKTFKEATSDKQLGPYVLAWLSGRYPKADGSRFEPKDDSERALQEAAVLLIENDPSLDVVNKK